MPLTSYCSTCRPSSSCCITESPSSSLCNICRHHTNCWDSCRSHTSWSVLVSVTFGLAVALGRLLFIALLVKSFFYKHNVKVKVTTKRVNSINIKILKHRLSKLDGLNFYVQKSCTQNISFFSFLVSFQTSS